MFEFFLPPPEVCGIKITPMVQKVLKSHHKVDINVQYYSQFRNIDKVTLKQLGGKFFAFDRDGSQSQHYKWLVPIYFKTTKINDLHRECVYMEINTVSKNKVLITKKDVIEFGNVPIGACQTEIIELENRGDHNVDIKVGLLSQFGGFTVINALKQVRKGEKGFIKLKFTPHDMLGVVDTNRLEFREVLKISAYSDQLLDLKKIEEVDNEYQSYCTSSLSLTLLGYGVKPEVALEPQN